MRKINLIISSLILGTVCGLAALTPTPAYADDNVNRRAIPMPDDSYTTDQASPDSTADNPDNTAGHDYAENSNPDAGIENTNLDADELESTDSEDSNTEDIDTTDDESDANAEAEEDTENSDGAALWPVIISFSAIFAAIVVILVLNLTGKRRS